MFALVFWLSFLFAVFVSFFAEYLVSITFGEQYAQSVKSFVVLAWVTPIAAIGSISVRYLVVEGLERKIMTRALIALVINFLLNLLLIPIYGIEGAAIATLISMFVAHYLLNYFDKELLQLVKIINGSFLIYKS